MQKNILLIFLIFFSIQLKAQYTGIPKQSFDLSGINFEKITFGVKITPGISWLGVKHNDAEADGASMKYGLGVVAEYEINPLLSVVSGVNYNTFGGYVFDSLSLNDAATKDNYRLNYSQIEIPLGLKLQSPATKKISYYLQGGVTTGFILTATEKHESSIPNTTLQPINILPLTSPSIIGFFLGVGTQCHIANNLKLFGEITYKNSLSNLALGSNYMTDGIHNYHSALELYPASMDFSIGLLF